jgi:hypothetical protein
MKLTIKTKNLVIFELQDGKSEIWGFSEEIPNRDDFELRIFYFNGSQAIEQQVGVAINDPSPATISKAMQRLIDMDYFDDVIKIEQIELPLQ